ncbi:hypothetical protein RJ641_017872, partial [Dillenia turbinata]
MDLEGKKFGRGPKELGGAVDLVNHFKLSRIHELFCKRSFPSLISETHYLHKVVGDTEILKGEEMGLHQLSQTSCRREADARLRPFELDILRDAFQFRESTPVDMQLIEKTFRSSRRKLKSESIDKEKTRKKHRHRDKEKNNDSKKHKQHHKDKSNDKEKLKIQPNGSIQRNRLKRYSYFYLLTPN